MAAGRLGLRCNHAYVDCHVHPCGHPHETSRNRHDLPDVAPHGDGNQVGAAYAAVSRIKGDPAGAGDIDLGPRVGRARTRHDDDYWNEVDKVMPDFRDRREWLKINGANLNL